MIRLANNNDMTEILRIYAHARNFMAEHGNPNQWGKTNPKQFVLEEDMEKRQLYVCTGNKGIYGVFALVPGDDPTYAKIEQGTWKSDAPYGTIHRIASAGTSEGVFTECMAYCKAKYHHLRIDTHADNHIMKHCVEKSGFVRCGIIYLSDGSPRIAYEYMGGYIR